MKRIKKMGTVEELIGRARKLSPDARPRWGRLNARQMLCHVTDVARLVLGEIPTRPRDPARAPRAKPLARVPMKQLFLYFLPWPHGVRGPREAFTTQPGALDEDVKTLEALLSRFKECEAKDVWPPHPLFGRMSTADGIACCTGTPTIISGSSGSEIRMRRAALRVRRHQASGGGMNPPPADRGDAPLRAPDADAGSRSLAS